MPVALIGCEFVWQVHALAKQNEMPRLLMTIPGIGPIIAMFIVAEIEDIKRFDSYRKLSAYSGLVGCPTGASPEVSGEGRASMKRSVGARRETPIRAHRIRWHSIMHAIIGDPIRLTASPKVGHVENRAEDLHLAEALRASPGHHPGQLRLRLSAGHREESDRDPGHLRLDPGP